MKYSSDRRILLASAYVILGSIPIVLIGHYLLHAPWWALGLGFVLATASAIARRAS